MSATPFAKRCALVLLALGIILCSSTARAAAHEPIATGSCPLVGAIRWDAWHGPDSVPGQAVIRTLTPARWHWRLPFFASVAPDASVSIQGDTPAVMDQEIGYAKTAGLDYWAFVAYPPADSMSRGLRRYLASERRTDVNFCIISEINQWQPGKVGEQVARFADLMALPNYQKLAGGRPLFYFLDQAVESTEAVWAAAGGFREAVKALRAAVHQRSGAEPYIVLMNPWAEKAQAFAAANGCDAISAYATQAGGEAAPYLELTAWTEGFWEKCRTTGAKVIPLVMSGWDRRPRVETPVPWEHNAGPSADLQRYYLTPKPEELAVHLSHALDWVSAHPQTAEARAVIIYAWNEHDEGSWLCPTLAEGDARIQALRSVLSPKRH